MNTKHPCKGDYLEKFVQPAILSLLCEGGAHGFYLFQEMERRELTQALDSTGFYRALSKLQEDGKLEFEWELQDGKRPRKVYHITEKGIRCLQNWRNTLRDYQVLVERMAALTESALSRRETSREEPR